MNPKTRPTIAALVLFPALTLFAGPAGAGLFLLTATGTITTNSSGDPTIPAGAPWLLEVVYDTAAPDLDFEWTGSPDPTFGRFNNSAATPALTFFHFRAGAYEVRIDDPSDFAAPSDMLITFTSIHAIDINILAPDLFPPLGGGPVSFHADFNAFDKAPVLSSDGLPTDTGLNANSFDEIAVTLILSTGVVNSIDLTSLTLTPVPEPASALLLAAGLAALPAAGRRRSA